MQVIVDAKKLTIYVDCSKRINGTDGNTHLKHYLVGIKNQV
ncbi:hypothetical protein NC651_039691 [Populus alba x Populus x berolinensis]|nr:hypothetical protein NC651_039691 [Populus alba x Populus x berolinensis]